MFIAIAINAKKVYHRLFSAIKNVKNSNFINIRKTFLNVVKSTSEHKKHAKITKKSLKSRNVYDFLIN